MTPSAVGHPAFAAAIDLANRSGRPLDEILRHHLLESLLRRLPQEPQAPALVLRGSMIARLWASPYPRTAADLDLLGTTPHDVAATADRIVPALAPDRAPVDDGVAFDTGRCTAKGIWLDTAFPGVRLAVFAQVFGAPATTTIDVGFGDPLVPDPIRVEYPWIAGGSAPVWAVHPATLIGWKLHGLAEWGRIRWRPKDALDLWLLVRRFGAEIPPAVLGEAVRVAFTSRGYAATDARRTLEDPFWRSPVAAARWDRHGPWHGPGHDQRHGSGRGPAGAGAPPAPLDALFDALLQGLGPALAAIEAG